MLSSSFWRLSWSIFASIQVEDVRSAPFYVVIPKLGITERWFA